MSEHLTKKTHEEQALPSGDHEKIAAHAEHVKAEHSAKQHETKQSNEAETARLEAIRNHVEAAADKNEAVKVETAETPASPAPSFVNRELKVLALQRSLKHIRRQLPAPQRVLSRVMHQPVVRAVSEASSKTISRPSGLLGGGICAFLGSLLYLYLAKHIGFSYNYFLFILLFGGGFVVGMVLELGVYVLRPKKS